MSWTLFQIFVFHRMKIITFILSIRNNEKLWNLFSEIVPQEILFYIILLCIQSIDYGGFKIPKIICTKNACYRIKLNNNHNGSFIETITQNYPKSKYEFKSNLYLRDSLKIVNNEIEDRFIEDFSIYSNTMILSFNLKDNPDEKYPGIDKLLLGFGKNDNYQLASSQTKNQIVPLILKDVITFSCGKEHTVILTKNGLFGTGSNFYGQLGQGDERTFFYLLNLGLNINYNNLLDFFSLSCGPYNTMLLTKNELFITGNNKNGQLGIGYDIYQLPKFNLHHGLSIVGRIINIEHSKSMCFLINLKEELFYSGGDTVLFKKTLIFIKLNGVGRLASICARNEDHIVAFSRTYGLIRFKKSFDFEKISVFSNISMCMYNYGCTKTDLIVNGFDENEKEIILTKKLCI